MGGGGGGGHDYQKVFANFGLFFYCKIQFHLLFLCVACCIFCWEEKEIQDQLKETKKTVSSQKNRLEAHRSNAEKQKESIERKEQTIEDLKEKNEDLSTNNEKLETQNFDFQQSINELEQNRMSFFFFFEKAQNLFSSKCEKMESNSFFYFTRAIAVL